MARPRKYSTQEERNAAHRAGQLRYARSTWGRAVRRSWKKTKAGRRARKRYDHRRRQRIPLVQRRARLLLLQEHLRQKEAAHEERRLPPSLEATRAGLVRELFASASVAEAAGDEGRANELERMALTLRGPVPKPEGDGIAGLRTDAEPLNSQGIAPDEVSALLEISDDLAHFNPY